MSEAAHAAAAVSSRPRHRPDPGPTVTGVSLPRPVTLTGDLVVLEPLSDQHHDGLVDAATDGRLWTLGYTRIPSPEQMRGSIAEQLRLAADGLLVPFVVRQRSTGRLVGQTTYLNLDPENRRLEIGNTWCAQSEHRSGVNVECKLLLLGHAFGQLGCIAVELRTHWLNVQSRRAIERLGAKQDGVLRSHRIMPDGSLRDTVVYSVLQHEWPAVRAELERRRALRR